MALFRKARPEEPLIVSITGARIGQRVLGVVGTDTRLFLDVAAKVGITGQAVAIAADPDAVARFEHAAIARGVLVEVIAIALPLPLPDASFDVALVDERTPRAGPYQTRALSQDILRVLCPGGRIVLAVAVPVESAGRALRHHAERPRRLSASGLALGRGVHCGPLPRGAGRSRVRRGRAPGVGGLL